MSGRITKSFNRFGLRQEPETATEKTMKDVRLDLMDILNEPRGANYSDEQKRLLSGSKSEFIRDTDKFAGYEWKTGEKLEMKRIELLGRLRDEVEAVLRGQPIFDGDAKTARARAKAAAYFSQGEYGERPVGTGPRASRNTLLNQEGLKDDNAAVLNSYDTPELQELLRIDEELIDLKIEQNKRPLQNKPDSVAGKIEKIERNTDDMVTYMSSSLLGDSNITKQLYKEAMNEHRHSVSATQSEVNPNSVHGNHAALEERLFHAEKLHKTMSDHMKAHFGMDKAVDGQAVNGQAFNARLNKIHEIAADNENLINQAYDAHMEVDLPEVDNSVDWSGARDVTIKIDPITGEMESAPPFEPVNHDGPNMLDPRTGELIKDRDGNPLESAEEPDAKPEPTYTRLDPEPIETYIPSKPQQAPPAQVLNSAVDIETAAPSYSKIVELDKKIAQAEGDIRRAARSAGEAGIKAYDEYEHYRDLARGEHNANNAHGHYNLREDQIENLQNCLNKIKGSVDQRHSGMMQDTEGLLELAEYQLAEERRQLPPPKDYINNWGAYDKTIRFDLQGNPIEKEAPEPQLNIDESSSHDAALQRAGFAAPADATPASPSTPLPEPGKP